MFLSSNIFEYYRLPLKFEESIEIMNRFYIKPLIPLFTANGKFYVLALSKGKIKLLRGTHFKVQSMGIKGAPRNISEALKYDDPEREGQFHTTTSGSREGVVFHGQGLGSDEDIKANVLRYLQKVNKELNETLRSEQVPLILAGEEYLVSYYKKVNTYPNLVEESITKNINNLCDVKIHDMAWDIIEPRFKQSQKEAVGKFKQLEGEDSHLISDNIRNILSSSYNGQVEILYVEEDRKIKGKFDIGEEKVMLSKEGDFLEEDLLDLACVYTLLRNGTVYILKSEEMPTDKEVVAIYRY